MASYKVEIDGALVSKLSDAELAEAIGKAREGGSLPRGVRVRRCKAPKLEPATAAGQERSVAQEARDTFTTYVHLCVAAEARNFDRDTVTKAITALTRKIEEAVDPDDPDAEHPINVRDESVNRQTPLHLAARGGAPQTLRVLLTHCRELTRPDINIEHLFGHTPLRALMAMGLKDPKRAECFWLLVDYMKLTATPDRTCPVPLEEMLAMRDDTIKWNALVRGLVTRVDRDEAAPDPKAVADAQRIADLRATTLSVKCEMGNLLITLGQTDDDPDLYSGWERAFTSDRGDEARRKFDALFLATAVAFQEILPTMAEM